MIQSYTWKDGDTQIATGYNPTIDMNVGIYTITLTVTDDIGSTDSDEVIINVKNGSVSVQDSLALVALYDSTNGDSWTNNDNWLSGPVAEWHGIKVAEGRVTQIQITSNNMSGKLPEVISSLTGLEYLNLQKNELSGKLPSGLCALTKLTSMSFSENQLSGEIPGNLDSLTLLNSLYFNDNNLSGEIPSEIGNMEQLNNFYLQNNNLTGNIPPELGNLIHLRFFDLSNNQLSGKIPSELGNLIGLLKLILKQNNLSGEIPTTLGNIPNLNELYLNDNQLSGTIPASFGNFTQLTFLHLHDNNLSGEIPSELGNLSKLWYLYLHRNQLTGEIPAELGNLTKASIILLNSNHLSGEIPDSLGNLSLTALYLQDNNFTKMPDFRGTNLSTTIKNLYIEDNMLDFGTIEPNRDIAGAGFRYSPQDSVGQAIDTTLASGTAYNISVSVGGTANICQWLKDGVNIAGADSSSYEISSIAMDDSGSYVCKITNTLAVDLTLYSRPVKIHTQIATDIAISGNSSLPQEYALQDNYPNPFNPSTKIKFSLPEAAKVTIEIYNILGQKIAILLDAQKEPGYHSVTFNAMNLTSGIYFYSIKTDNFHQIKKMMLIK